jgi:hypothetical protein
MIVWLTSTGTLSCLKWLGLVQSRKNAQSIDQHYAASDPVPQPLNMSDCQREQS